MSKKQTLNQALKDDEFRELLFYHLSRMLITSLVFTALFIPIVEDMSFLFLIFLACFGMWKLGAVSQMLWEERKR